MIHMHTSSAYDLFMGNTYGIHALTQVYIIRAAHGRKREGQDKAREKQREKCKERNKGERQRVVHSKGRYRGKTLHLNFFDYITSNVFLSLFSQT